jgi:hypothetical protein
MAILPEFRVDESFDMEVKNARKEGAILLTKISESEGI